jgi:hypothetical protein
MIQSIDATMRLAEMDYQSIVMLKLRGDWLHNADASFLFRGLTSDNLVLFGIGILRSAIST